MSNIQNLVAYEEICQEVYTVLLQEDKVDDITVKRIISWVTGKRKIENELNIAQRLDLEERIFNRFRRLDILQPLLDDQHITEIMVNKFDEIFYEKNGKLFQSPERFKDRDDLENIITSFFAKYNVPLSNSTPMNSLRLEDGSRANAVLPPIAQDSPVLTIRKFTGIRPNLENLIASKFLSRDLAEYLIRAVRQHQAIIIGGGTGTGKTTLLNILSAYIPENERIITIEDSPELQLQNRKNWVKLVTRDNGPDGSGAVTSSALIRNALRMRPDRIIVGEVRGSESYDMLQAAMSGHPGTLCTVHGNNCLSMFLRTADLILSSSKMQYEVILRQLTDAFDLLIHIKRDENGHRYINEVRKIIPSEETIFDLIEPDYRGVK